MPEMKTREIVERGAPIGRAPLQQAKMIGQQVQNAALHIKENTERGAAQPDGAPEEYAADRIAGSASGVAVGVVYGFDRAGRQGVRDTYANAQAAKAQFQKAQQRKMLEHSTHQGKGTVSDFPLQECSMLEWPLLDSAQPAANRTATPFRTGAQGNKAGVHLKDSARKGKLPPSPKTAHTPRTPLPAARSASQAAQKAHAVKQIRTATMHTKGAVSKR